MPARAWGLNEKGKTAHLISYLIAAEFLARAQFFPSLPPPHPGASPDARVRAVQVCSGAQHLGGGNFASWNNETLLLLIKRKVPVNCPERASERAVIAVVGRV